MCMQSFVALRCVLTKPLKIITTTTRTIAFWDQKCCGDGRSVRTSGSILKFHRTTTHNELNYRHLTDMVYVKDVTFVCGHNVFILSYLRISLPETWHTRTSTAEFQRIADCATDRPE